MAKNNGFFSQLKNLFNKGIGGKQKPNGTTHVPSAAGYGQVYTGGAPLIRQKYLWGSDDDGNPCFLMLIGEQPAQNRQSHSAPGNSVAYTDSVIFRGKDGHFPTFESVRVVEYTDYPSRKRIRNAFYKRDAGRYGNPTNRERALPDYIALKTEVLIPDNMSHSDCVRLIQSHGYEQANFTLAENPTDVLKLDEALSPYYEGLIMLFTNPNLYMRKKALTTLMAKKPPKQIWTYLQNHGSSELIAGLFLEFALKNDDSLLAEAAAAIDASFHWTSDSYAQGIRRSASLYLNSFDDSAKAKRINFLRETLPQLKFHPVHVNNKDIQEDKILNGAQIRKYSLQGFLSEHYYKYSREERRTIQCRREKLYEKGYYSDAVTLKTVQVKNTIQEGLIYGAADILGKTAYYLDAPGLVYYFTGNGKSKSLRYFRRYLIRVFNEYAKTDEAGFMQAMKHLLTSYTPADYCCKFPGNFQFNYFLRHYLYSSFDKKPPVSWQERPAFMRNDQCMAAEGRYEYMPEIWNRHFNCVIEIAVHGKIDTVLKGMYFILKDPQNAQKLESEVSYHSLSAIASSTYKPLAQLGVTLIQTKLNAEDGFNAEIMVALMKSENQNIHSMAREYFMRANGAFLPKDLAALLLMPDLEKWEPMIRENLLKLDGAGYITFLQTVTGIADKSTETVTNQNDTLSDILNATLHMLNQASREQKADFLLSLIIRAQLRDCSEWTHDFTSRIIFTLPIPELKELLKTPKIEHGFAKSDGGILIALLRAVRDETPPEDERLAELLEKGSPQMLRALTELLDDTIDKLSQRFSVLRLLLECDVAALNELAKSVFERLSAEEQEKLHLAILDSPVRKAYVFGLEKLSGIYESNNRHVPKAFIVKMMEHTSPEVKGFIAGKVKYIMETLGGGDGELFMYYAKTLLLLPNRLSRDKDHIYAALPRFVPAHEDKRQEIEQLLLEIGGSNIIRDSERALVALASLRKEAV